jgi:hypothetical protein
MGKRNNYSFEKYQKENKRKKKQAEKLEKKRLKKLENAPETDPAAQPPAADGVADAEPTTGQKETPGP